MHFSSCTWNSLAISAAAKAAWTIRVLGAVILVAVILVAGFPLNASAASSYSRANKPILVSAESVQVWTEGGTRILLLQGNVLLAQGAYQIRSESAVVWIHELAARNSSTTELEVYCESRVRVFDEKPLPESDTHFGYFQTSQHLVLNTKRRESNPGTDSAIFLRGVNYRNDLAPETSEADLVLTPNSRRFGSNVAVNSEQPEGPGKKLRQAQWVGEQELSGIQGATDLQWKLFSRGSRPFDFNTVTISETEKALVVTGGINVVVYNVPNLGTVDIAADQAVLWTRDIDGIMNRGTDQMQDVPLELYLEGNVVVRQQGRTIESAQMYYDVQRHLALANDAEISAYHELLRSPIRFRALRLRQVAENRFVGEKTSVTPSIFPFPTYQLQVGRVTLEQFDAPQVDLFTGRALIDKNTGEVATVTKNHITGEDNYFVIGDYPIFYWPFAEAVLEEFQTPLRSIKFRQSRSFGTELQTTWNMFQLLGVPQPDEISRWDLDLDYLSERGPAAGTYLKYRGWDPFGLGSQNKGLVDTWWIHDSGEDRLGRGRINVPPEQQFRGRFLLRHLQQFEHGFSLAVEAAWITDINFLEQYFETEWEEEKDQETLLYLKQQQDNWAWTLLARKRVLDFVRSTDYLPSLSHHLVGEPLFSNLFTYYTHSSIAYLDNQTADRSFGDIRRLPESSSNSAGRIDSLHEINLPITAGSVKVVPYLMGRASAWSETVRLGSQERWWGAAGARASMPLWRVYPSVQNSLLNLNGLAHKIVFSLDYQYARTDLDHTELFENDELEEDSEQVFRERFTVRDFTRKGNMFPDELDPRRFAIRSGLMTHAETVDDLHVVRLGMAQRFQTQRGPADSRRIMDWMILDLGAALYPDSDRDNFGETIGLITHHYEWHIGDRTTLLSDGWFETYDNGPRTWTIGAFIDRPPRGSVYLGYTTLHPIDSRVLRGSYNYYMSPKWVSSLSASYDFGEAQNLGQSLFLTRIGADIVFRIGIRFNPLRRDFGIGIELSPRIAPSLGVAQRGGRSGRVATGLPIDFAPVE